MFRHDRAVVTYFDSGANDATNMNAFVGSDRVVDKSGNQTGLGNFKSMAAATNHTFPGYANDAKMASAAGVIMIPATDDFYSTGEKYATNRPSDVVMTVRIDSGEGLYFIMTQESAGAGKQLSHKAYHSRSGDVPWRKNI
ncbi:hypothetical protein FACS1894187_17650 [Synergistales bacterium]|nr:hypothetical protein FACS1894187_17650 [Synergistales bacterium]